MHIGSALTVKDDNTDLCLLRRICLQKLITYKSDASAESFCFFMKKIYFNYDIDIAF